MANFFLKFFILYIVLGKMALVRVQQPTDYVLFEGSQPSIVPESKESKKNLYKYFELIVTITHWTGVIFLVLDGKHFSLKERI